MSLVDRVLGSAEAKRRARREEADQRELSGTFQAAVSEGQLRLQRTTPQLLATGLVGGIDLGVGVAALLLVQAETGSKLLGAAAFTVGFVCLTLARSELFTENFLVPVSALVAHKTRLGGVVRLWTGTLIANLAAGWLAAALIVAAFARVEEAALKLGGHYPEMGIGWEAFSSGLVGGAVITLMTWMERRSASEVGHLVAAVTMSFVLVAGPLNHVIVSSLEMFAALQVGAPFGYADWAGAAAWAALANAAGGLGPITLLRLVQVGSEEILSERRRPSSESG
jgi:formate/nitrite transporter FocA (FNT family)